MSLNKLTMELLLQLNSYLIIRFSRNSIQQNCLFSSLIFFSGFRFPFYLFKGFIFFIPFGFIHVLSFVDITVFPMKSWILFIFIVGWFTVYLFMKK